jgi:hypothetical protein
MTPPGYFQGVRSNAARLWDQLEANPELAAPWHQLFRQVQSPRHVLSELLQNADDAGATEASVRIEADEFAFTHNGLDFTEENFASLCRFGYSNKKALHTIGFRGIGFKSVFSLGSTVRLRTPTLSVAFDSHRFTQPRWVEPPEGSEQLTEVRVAIEDAHRRKELERNLKEWLGSPISLLFFKCVRRLHIDGNTMRWEGIGPGPVANSERFALNGRREREYLLIRSGAEPFPAEAMAEIRQERMLNPDQVVDFPPSAVEIVLGAEGRLYVVLPTGVWSKLPFACNAPFIQDPARLKVKDPETSPTNRWLLGRIGALAASAMVEWLGERQIDQEARCRAYDLLPVVDGEDSSLEGICSALTASAFRRKLEGKSFLLTDSGDLKGVRGAVAVPSALREVWPDEQIPNLFDGERRPLLAVGVSEENRQKLVKSGLLDEIVKADVIGVLRSAHLPRPASWRQLLRLWVYVAPEVMASRYFRSEKALKIVPVQGQDTLHASAEIVRLGDKRLLQSDADWEFLARYLVVLNPNWPRYLAEQRKLADETGQGWQEVGAAYGVLDALGLQEASDVSKVVDQVAAKFFGEAQPVRSACIQLAQIAAKLNAAAGVNFRFVTRDGGLRGISDNVVIDPDGALDGLVTRTWGDTHVLHHAYLSEPGSCTHEEWQRWVASGRAGLAGFVPLSAVQSRVWGKERLADELRRREASLPDNYPFKTYWFQFDDWDFADELWRHWEGLSKEDPKLWARVTERILKQPDSYWSRAKSAKVSQVAQTGSMRQIVFDPLLPRWILRFRELPCLLDTRGTPRKPGELLCRTPSTEAVIDVEPFVHASLDREATRPVLELLGVRNTPTGPDRLLGYLRAFAGSGNAPAHEVEKWYRRLDQMIDTGSTEDAAAIRKAFQEERIVLAEDGSWTTVLGAFLMPDDSDAPGVALIRASVRDLALWRKVGVADQPTADLAIAWLKQLPSGALLSPDEARRVRILLPRHADRIWRESGHWLNLAGEWAPIESLKYALTMQSLVSWGHLHDWVKKATADLQKLPLEATETPGMKALPFLADCIEEQFEESPGFRKPETKRAWLEQLGGLLARTEWDDVGEQERIRQLGRDLAESRWQVVPGIEIVPYIGGMPAGTPRQADVLWKDRLLYTTDRPSARLAKGIAQELGRAFRRQEIGDAIKMCFERPVEFITAYMEENFKLAPEVVEEEALALTGTDGPLSAAGIGTYEEAVPAVSETEGLEAIEHRAANANSVDAIQIEDAGETETAESVEEPQQEARPAKERPAARAPQLPLIERFARSQRYHLNGDGRYCRQDGSWIGKANGDVFPWERGNARGEIVMRYWPREHCLECEPLEVDSEVWSLIEKLPDSHALILADPDGKPVELLGARLRALREQGSLRIFPASYRLKIEDGHQQ